jgi:biotin-(acetyl-CoA carboxylase) ligase
MLHYIHSSLIHNSQKLERTRCPSTEESIQKMWNSYTMEYYSAIKNNEFMKFLETWIELEDIILSEVTQSQKNTHDMHSLISGY